MRLPRVRFSVRQLTVTVAVVALAMGAGDLALLSRKYRALARAHARLARRCNRLADEFEGIYVRTAKGPALRDAPSVLVPTPGYAPDERLRTTAAWPSPTWEGADASTRGPHDTAEWRSEATRHANLSVKYERAAWRPWAPVSTDLPGP